MAQQRTMLSRVGLLLGSMGIVLGLGAASAPADRPLNAKDAKILSEFGERPAFSPDGSRIAFIGKSYGDAYEIELASRRTRNLTSGFPHQGIVRIQYLSDGNYLVTAPRRHIGANSRASLEMWLLRRDLTGGLQSLGERPFEGIAVSRRSNLIAWTALDPVPSFKPGESWFKIYTDHTKARHFVAEVTYRDGAARIDNKREIMSELPNTCSFVELQDFRDGDRELTFSCVGRSAVGVEVSVMSYRIDTGQYRTYRSVPGEYTEVEGIAPDGSWTTVECGSAQKPGLLDICRLDLAEGGAMRPLVIGTEPGSTRLISNSVVSPDGKWISFQSGDQKVGEPGEGLGVFIIGLSNKRHR